MATWFTRFLAASPPGPAVASLLLLAAVAAGTACQGEAGAPASGAGPPGGGRPAMGVEVVTLAERPVEQTTELIGTVKSRRSTTIQPQVEGFITRIAVRSGDRVRPGSVLMEIDSGRQQAAVASLESQRAARQADLQFARQQAQRLKTLYDAGAVSQQEYEQAQTALSAGEAQLKAIEAQIQEQRVELGYHRVTAPTAGVVGDIPVRVGDRVTQSTVLTTVDANAGLEVYVSVPVQQAPGLKIGLPVHLVDDRRKVLQETEITFVSPQVDEATQSVLVKAALKDPQGWRTEQFVRVRIVWTTAPAITVPVVAVNRINGQYFAFVAEQGEGGTLVARQRAVTLGDMAGNDYVVLDGLEAGERLIVSGVQKIGEGMPVRVGPPGPPPGAPAGAEGR
jgi:RND family efflux transporter MFP subunit